MSSASAKPSKFSSGFPGDFARANVGVIAYYTAMIALFELFMAPQLSQVLGGAMRAIYLYAAHLNIKSRSAKYVAAHGGFPGDQAVLKGFSSALLATAGLCFYYAIEDYTTSK